MVTFSEVIIRGGASIPRHPFLVEVFDYFNIVPFQFTPNSISTIVAYYIVFIEANIGEPLVVEFVYIYCIKALARNKVFWYTSKRDPDVKGVWGVHDNIGNYKDRYFFYPSDRPGEFRVGVSNDLSFL